MIQDVTVQTYDLRSLFEQSNTLGFVLALDFILTRLVRLFFVHLKNN